jgi:hypothetical protein
MPTKLRFLGASSKSRMSKGAIDSFGRFSVPWLTHSCLKFSILLTLIDYPSLPDPGPSEDHAHLSVYDFLSLTRTSIKRLSAKGILKSRLYSYLLDLIEEDVSITDNDV